MFFREVHSLTGKRRQRILELRDRYEAVWQQVLHEGVAEDLLRFDDPLTVKGLLGLHNYSYLWLDPHGQRTPEQIADHFLDTALNGLLRASRK